MMKIEELLPIGTVVLLKNGTKRLMISGVKQSDADDSNRVHDYVGVMYPEGHIGVGFQYLFDHEDIKTVIFRGYDDSERTRFLKRLAEFFEK